MSDPSRRPSDRPGAMALPPPPGSASYEVDVVITTRNDGPGLFDLVMHLPDRGIHELVIVDDGSTDIHTRDGLERLEDDGYHVVRQDHRGSSRARNEGARVSTAPFLLYLDTGTVPLDGFLAEASTRLHDDSTIAAVLADGRWQDGGAPIVVSKPDPVSMVAEVQFHPVAVLRRAAIEKVGGWDERLETGQDRDLFLSLVETGWSFAKLPSVGFTRSTDAGEPVSDPGLPPSGTTGAASPRSIMSSIPLTSPRSSVPMSQPWPKPATIARRPTVPRGRFAPCTI